MNFLLHLLSSLKSWIYDVIIVAMTAIWYREVLTRLPMNARVLDVGIGTATSLIDNRDIVISKNIHFTGVDYDAAYIDAATEAIRRHRLTPFVGVVCCSIHEYDPKKHHDSNNNVHRHHDHFDAIYFSGSFMIIPDKVKALQRTVAFLKPSADSRIYFTQTFESPGIVGFAMTYIKPMLKYLLSIDFGSVTYEGDFRQVLRDADVTISELHVIQKSAFRRQVLVVAAPSPHHLMARGGQEDEPHPRTWSELVSMKRRSTSPLSDGKRHYRKEEEDLEKKEDGSYDSHWF